MTKQELDLLIAEKVLGFEWYHMNAHGKWLTFLLPPGGDEAEYEYYEKGKKGEVRYDGVPALSTYIGDTWLVVDKMNERGYGFWLHLDSHDPKVAGSGYATASFRQFDMSDEGSPSARSVPLAICLAALREYDVEIHDWEVEDDT